jgi:hypothetical protein
MDEQAKRKAVRRYFEPRRFPILSAILLLVGVFFLADGRAVGLGLLLMMPFPAIMLWRALRPRPSHEQIDAWLAEDLAQLAPRALRKLDLDEEDIVTDGPLRIIAPILWSTHGVPESETKLFRVEKRGKQKVARYAIHHVTAIILTKDHLGAYWADFNFLRNAFLNEHAQEFHYRDVVSVSLQEDSTNLTLTTGQKMVHAQQFRLSVTSGEHISVVVGSREIEEATGAKQDTDSVEKVVRAIRKMLRERKEIGAAGV